MHHGNLEGFSPPKIILCIYVLRDGEITVMDKLILNLMV